MPDLNVLNTLDWIILVILTWSIFSGVWRGFSHEVFGLIGLVLAFIITSFVAKLLDGPMATMLPDNAMGRMFSRAIIFLACILMINIATSMMAAALREILSRAVDHSLGLLFGFLRGALLILLPYLLVNLYIDPKVYPDWLVEAHSYPFLNGGAHILRQFIPKAEIDDPNRTDFGELKKAAQEQQDVLDEAAAKKVKPKKDKKSEDSTGNSKWKAVMDALKESFPN